MLPFLDKNKKNIAGLIMATRKPDNEDEKAEGSGLEAAAQDILRAIEAKDHKHLALAIRAAFDICDAEPHVEGKHLNEGNEE